MSSEIKKIAINTGGGDAPGLNAVIRAIVHAASQRGWECWGIRDGYNGLLDPERYQQEGGGLFRLTPAHVRGITHLGGTILGTTNRGNPLHYPVLQPDGSYVETDRSQEIIDILAQNQIDALIAIGGDGSLGIAHQLAEKGLRVIGVPKTIDNDLDKTVSTFGFDTAVAFATDCIDRLHSTAEAHQRLLIVEVMGRYAGWIALHSGIAGTADCILIPEIPYDPEIVAAKVMAREKAGRHFSIIVVAEGARPKDGAISVIGKSVGQAERLGGAGEKLSREMETRTGKETRLVVLGHLQRGGIPTSADRLLALRFGAAAVRALALGYKDSMVAYAPPTVEYVPLEQAIGKMKCVDLQGDTIATARELGISFGDMPHIPYS
jgi:6-phosphofructokinase 1